MAMVNTVVPSSAIPAKIQSFSDFLKLLTTEETVLLDRIGFDSLSKVCSDTTHYYPQRVLTPKRTTLNGLISSSGTTIIFTEACYIAGEEVAIESEVVTLGTTSDNLTFTNCARHAAYNVAHATLAICNGLGIPRAEAFAAGTLSDPFQEVSTITTYPRLFARNVYVGDTSKGLQQHGIQGTKWDDVMHDALISIKKEMNNAILFSDAVAPSTTATAGKFDGLIPRARAASLTADLSGLALTRDDLSTGVKALRNRGHKPSVLLVSLYSHRVLNALYEAGNIMSVEGQLGGHARAVDVDGAILEIVSHPDINSQCLVLETNGLGFGPLQGMSMHVKPLGADGSRERAMIQGQYVFECPGPGAYLLTGCKNS